MKILKCIAVDDEPLALDLLKDNIKRIGYLNLVASFSNGAEALNYLSSNKVDLIFLDIQMPKLTGIELSKKLNQHQMVIFTTAFEHYAVESYSLNAIDYLLKPIDYTRFEKACEKAYDADKMKEIALKNQYIIISSEYEKIKIDHKDILYIQGMKDYVKVYLTNKSKPILTRMNLKTIFDTLDSNHFARIHKSYIINLSKVDRVKGNTLQLGENTIPIGVAYKQVKIFFH